MKKILLNILNILLVFNIYAFSKYDSYSIEPSLNISFNENGKGYIIYNESNIQEFNFLTYEKNHITFIETVEKNYIKYSDYKINKMILLLGKIKDTNQKIAFSYCNIKSDKYGCLRFIDEYPRAFEVGMCEFKDCSSFLIENNKIYNTDNLKCIDLETPWVENAAGNGIGEGFTIIKKNRKFNYLLIMNGYISYDKPYLYEQNSRIRMIKITGLTSGISKVLCVVDTPNPQTIDISFLPYAEDIRFEIVDVYEGIKYTDTCIQYVGFFDYEVIPYLDEN